MDVDDGYLCADEDEPLKCLKMRLLTLYLSRVRRPLLPRSQQQRRLPERDEAYECSALDVLLPVITTR